MSVQIQACGGYCRALGARDSSSSYKGFDVDTDFLRSENETLLGIKPNSREVKSLVPGTDLWLCICHSQICDFGPAM